MSDSQIDAYDHENTAKYSTYKSDDKSDVYDIVNKYTSDAYHNVRDSYRKANREVSDFNLRNTYDNFKQRLQNINLGNFQNMMDPNSPSKWSEPSIIPVQNNTSKKVSHGLLVFIIILLIILIIWHFWKNHK